MTDAFATPRWLRDAGLTAWMLVGITLLLVGAVWLLSLTHTIVMPLIAAGVVAAVASPMIAWLERHRVPRGLGAALLMLASVALGIGVFLVILAGITSESGAIGNELSNAKDKLASWLQDAGVDAGKADAAKEHASTATSSSFDALLDGVAKGIEGLTSLVFFLSLTALSLFFLLKDGPVIRAWAERNVPGVPVPIARNSAERILEALRGYFLGVTIVAVFNGVVIGGGALILGVPLAGTIAAVTFLGAYIPYLGAWTAGAFSVLLALGGAGTDAAIAMAVLQLLGNGILQQMIQPIAYGAALGIHPLAVLVVTIGGGALFGAVGLILAAPITSAIVRIAADLAESRASAAAPPQGAA